MTRLADTEHSSRPWRIHEIAGDFRLEDVWELPIELRDEHDFARFVEMLAGADPARGGPVAVRVLNAIREMLGTLLRWDAPDTGIGSRVASLGERLPADLRSRPAPSFAALPAQPLYLLDDEFAAEIANRTMHGVLHLGRVEDSNGGHLRMAVLVKPNGLLGNAYMVAIRPFRHLIVYPALFRQWERAWLRRSAREAV